VNRLQTNPRKEEEVLSESNGFCCNKLVSLVNIFGSKRFSCELKEVTYNILLTSREVFIYPK
jgi:hypothetical protein